MNERRVIFSTPSNGGRLDHVLVERLGDISRSRIQRLIRQGNVLVDGQPIHKTGFKLEGGEEVEISVPPPAPSTLVPESIPLDVIYEDDNLLVVNKPPSMVVHPSAGHETGTMVHAVLAHAPDLRGVGEIRRPGVVHRLDKDTSGLILFAKDDATHQWLQRQFKDRLVKKTYLALVDGHPPTPSGRIEAAIGRDEKNRKRMMVVSDARGRNATTLYKTLETFPEHALLEVHPLTGRTHQIRVHLAFLDCPVAGDRVYGRRKPSLPIDRQMLHASQLEITLPGNSTPSLFIAPLADDFEHTLSYLRGDLFEL
ncbi:MAG: RluA family pseudouridine synthase [Anaerolineales bacterium]